MENTRLEHDGRSARQSAVRTGRWLGGPGTTAAGPAPPGGALEETIGRGAERSPAHTGTAARAWVKRSATLAQLTTFQMAETKSARTFRYWR